MSERRPPVVAILGHIDHGKSTLIDYIRRTNITGTHESERSVGRTEAGGITQHIGAYEVLHTSKDGRGEKLTFLDTPGHEAFSGVRRRGASAADIAILVVSAEDGVKPQTLEAIERIKESGLPYIVAITKIDRTGADVERAKQSLAEAGIYVEGYGGNVPYVALSAVTGEGVKELLDMVILLTELESTSGRIGTDSESLGSGVIIESRLDTKQGIIGTGIIKNGRVKRGLFAAAAGAIAPLRFILDAENNQMEELAASSPIQITGWDKLPKIGSEFKIFLKKDEAIAFAEAEEAAGENTAVKDFQKLGTEDLKGMPIIIKADTAGSLEAIEALLAKVSRERIAAQVIFSGVGSVSESDAKAALALGAVIMAFNTKVDPRASSLADRLGLEMYSFTIIYELVDKVKELLSSREPRIEVEELLGRVKVLKVFGATKDKQIIGARILEGEIKKGAVLKILRRESEIGRGKIKGLQQSKVEVDSVSEGIEFGAMIESKTEIAPGDILEAFVLVTK